MIIIIMDWPRKRRLIKGWFKLTGGKFMADKINEVQGNTVVAAVTERQI